MNVRVCSLKDHEMSIKLLESVMKTGFVVLVDHGIEKSFIRETQQAWREFFLSRPEDKKLFVNGNDPNMGYKGMFSEKAVGAAKADLKEFFHWKPGAEIPGEAYELTATMFLHLNSLSGLVLRVLDNSMYRGNFSYSDACAGSDNTILRSLYYPSMDFDQHPGAVRAAAHEDINFITLLVAASAPGLQVLDKNGRWHDVPHEENSIVINIGDMLQLASGGVFKSTTHRVVNPDGSGEDRISMPLFVHPHSETLLAPNFTAQKYLEQRIAEIYQKGGT